MIWLISMKRLFNKLIVRTTNKHFLNLIRILFTLFLGFHVFAILVMPNSNSILGRKLGPFIAPYANMVGMYASWEFFSPDPTQPFYFNYAIYFENDEGEELNDPIEGSFPEWKTERTLSPNKMRLKYALRFFSFTNEGIVNAFISYLCRQNPSATRIKVRSVFEVVPSLDKAQIQSWNLEDNRVKDQPIEAYCKDLN